MVVSSPQKSFDLLCETHGIKRQFSAARTPQQNGIAERKNRTVQEAARTMLNEAKLSDGYWREVVSKKVYILNIGQLRINSDKTLMNYGLEEIHQKNTSRSLEVSATSKGLMRISKNLMLDLMKVSCQAAKL
jgi:transposase InsO family protein